MVATKTHKLYYLNPNIVLWRMIQIVCFNKLNDARLDPFDVQGILFALPESIRYPMDLVHLWLHESSRVYSDKLMEEKDVELFNKILLDTGKRFFEVTKCEAPSMKSFGFNPLHFQHCCDFCRE